MKFNEQTPSWAPIYGKRSSDRDSKDVVHDAEDALVLLEAYRKKEISADSVGSTVPMEIVFGWLSDKTVSAQEFEELVSGRIETEVVVLWGGSNEDFPEEMAEAEFVKNVREKIAALPEKSFVESLGPDLVRNYCDAFERADSNLGAILRFEKKEADGDGPAIAFAVEVRFLKIASDGRDSARAELVFGWYGDPEETTYAKADVPLPIAASGRRKLFLTVTDSNSKTPLKIPPNVAMAFREKFLTKIEVRAQKLKSWGLMGAISKRVWKMIGGA